MVLQIYNKIKSHQEVGVPEALSLLLHYPVHYTTMEFQIINTTQLSSYVAKLHDTHGQADGAQDNHICSQILPVPGGYTLLSAFNDCKFRRESLNNYCLYDYRTMIYKRKYTMASPSLSITLSTVLSLNFAEK